MKKFSLFIFSILILFIFCHFILGAKISDNTVKIPETTTDYSVPASLQEDTVTVKSFGAKGDGSTDDKLAFINALSFSVANGMSLYIPNGTYNLNGLTFKATSDLKIIGESTENTILKNLGVIAGNSNMQIENFTILDMVGKNAIQIIPTNFSKVIIRNIKGYNTNSAFVSRSRADSFIEYTSPTKDVGVEWIEIDSCDATNFASYGIRLRGYVKGGVISNNRINNIGYDTNTGVCGILGGNQGDGNIVLGPIEKVTIRDNIIENIYSAYGNNETSEAHGILCYGSFLTIRNNTIKNLYGSGREEINLDSGYDHEAIYVKASDTTIDGNIIENGSGDFGQGAIAVKGGSRNKVIGNSIKNMYGMGITFENSQGGIEVTGNTVLLESKTIPRSKVVTCLTISGIDGGSELLINGNTFINRRPRTVDSKGACCLNISVSKSTNITNNYLYSTTDEVIRISKNAANSTLKIANNDIVSINSRIIYLGDVAAMTEITNNRFIQNYTRSVIDFNGNQGTIPKGILKITDNHFMINGSVSEVINLDNISRFTIIGNKFQFNNTSISGRIILVRPRHANSEFCLVSKNSVVGSPNVTNFMVFATGRLNIGSLLVRDNNITLANGRLLAINDGTTMIADYTGVINNYLKTGIDSDKIMLTAYKPAKNYTESGNVVE